MSDTNNGDISNGGTKREVLELVVVVHEYRRQLLQTPISIGILWILNPCV
jgi:hypothetical protein